MPLPASNELRCVELERADAKLRIVRSEGFIVPRLQHADVGAMIPALKPQLLL